MNDLLSKKKLTNFI